MITSHLEEPVVFFIPISGFTKNLQTGTIQCKQYNPDHKAKAIVETKEKISVNQLKLTDEEKAALFPEWHKDYYHSRNLIVEQVSYIEKEIMYPEFQHIEGATSYGNLLTATEYKDKIPCALYYSGEIAAVATRKSSHRRDSSQPPFYYTEPLPTIYMNVGTYVCVVVGSLLVSSIFVAYLMDSILMPKHIAILKTYRQSEWG